MEILKGAKKDPRLFNWFSLLLYMEDLMRLSNINPLSGSALWGIDIGITQKCNTLD